MRAFGRIGRDGMQTRRGNGLGAESEEKREPVSDIDTGVVDSLKALGPRRPIREADTFDDCRDGC
jgi:hypothetical protein